MTATFGTILKDWRTQRRMSQLDLGLEANVSARHISFLETGRSRPSRAMVLQLCDYLDVPRQSRNQLLTAAGHAAAYAARDLRDPAMTPAREAMTWMLERHTPYPAIAMDRHWRVVEMNSVSRMLMAGMGVSSGDSVLDALIENPRMREALQNFDEVAHHAIVRLHTESAHLGGDPVLDQAAERLAAMLPAARIEATGSMPVFIPAVYVAGGMRLSLFSTFSQFGSAEDITLSELKIEMMFPADDETRAVLEALAG